MAANNTLSEIRVDRAELVRYLKVLSKSMTPQDKTAAVSFDDGWLTIAVGDGDFSIAAEGRWPQPVSISSNWVLHLSKTMPSGDPVRVRLSGDLLYFNSFGVPFEELLPSKRSSQSKDLSKDDLQRIGRAAKSLGPFHVSMQDVFALVQERAQVANESAWSREEARLIVAVAKAWTELAPFGIATSDLRHLIDRAVFNAPLKRARTIGCRTDPISLGCLIRRSRSNSP